MIDIPNVYGYVNCQNGYNFFASKNPPQWKHTLLHLIQFLMQYCEIIVADKDSIYKLTFKLLPSMKQMWCGMKEMLCRTNY